MRRTAWLARSPGCLDRVRARRSREGRTLLSGRGCVGPRFPKYGARRPCSLQTYGGLLSPLSLSVLEPYPSAGKAKTRKESKGQAKGANFLELRLAELRRIHLPRTRVNSDATLRRQ